MLQLSYAEAIPSGVRQPYPDMLHEVTTTALADSNPRPIMIELENVSKSFGPQNNRAVTAIDNVNVRIPEHSITLIQGPNGSGKTTLLGIIGCMMRPSAGRVTVSGHDVTRLSEDLLAEMRRTHFGFIFQNRHLIRRATALENVMVPGLPCQSCDGDLRHRARSLLARFGIESKSNIRVERLSGGEQQRVAVARALINDPEVVIADEPTAHQDQESTTAIADTLLAIAATGATVVVTAHDARLLTSGITRHRYQLEYGRLRLTE